MNKIVFKFEDGSMVSSLKEVNELDCGTNARILDANLSRKVLRAAIEHMFRDTYLSGFGDDYYERGFVDIDLESEVIVFKCRDGFASINFNIWNA